MKRVFIIAVIGLYMTAFGLSYVSYEQRDVSLSDQSRILPMRVKQIHDATSTNDLTAWVRQLAAKQEHISIAGSATQSRGTDLSAGCDRSRYETV